MRLYSIHPKYLDQKGLCGLWAESLLAQAVLIQGKYKECSCVKEYLTPLCLICKETGKIKTAYYNHPQLTRFKQCKKPIEAIGHYLMSIYEEGISRGYNFDLSKIIHRGGLKHDKLTVTKGQIEYEFNHLQDKLKIRNYDIYKDNCNLLYEFNMIKSHPIFEVIKGNIESWEKVK